MGTRKSQQEQGDIWIVNAEPGVAGGQRVHQQLLFSRIPNNYAPRRPAVFRAGRGFRFILSSNSPAAYCFHVSPHPHAPPEPAVSLSLSHHNPGYPTACRSASTREGP